MSKCHEKSIISSWWHGIANHLLILGELIFVFVSYSLPLHDSDVFWLLASYALNAMLQCAWYIHICESLGIFSFPPLNCIEKSVELFPTMTWHFIACWRVQTKYTIGLSTILITTQRCGRISTNETENNEGAWYGQCYPYLYFVRWVEQTTKYIISAGLFFEWLWADDGVPSGYMFACLHK